MKTATPVRPDAVAAPIVTLSDAGTRPASDEPLRARAFAAPLLEGRCLDSGEDALAHADGMAAILLAVGASPAMRAAAWLVGASEVLARPEVAIREAFGESLAELVAHTGKLEQLQRATRAARQPDAERRAEQIERVRKMLLAFARDLRVVLLRLASRLQTLRWYAASKAPCPEALARESMQVFAPLANRLGIWQIKWEIEDLAFRFLEPDCYKQVARLLDESRLQREQRVEAARARLGAELRAVGIEAEVQGRPKHLYSIWKKMQGKQLDFGRIHDLRALRIIVRDVREAYAALARVHEQYRVVPGEFDDYIARPKPNGYQSLHTVVLDAGGLPVEVQIRTRAMHEHAESGVAAHWAYKEAGVKGYGGAASAAGGFAAQLAEARKAVLRQLLAWERDYAEGDTRQAPSDRALFDDRIYVFTPQAAIVELPAGATPIDFAYALHTDLGHRCRGAKVDGQMVPLNTRLASGQTVEVVAAKEGGPSLDWLNAELGYLKGTRSKAKVRAWFNALAAAQTIARGRELVEKLLQREGRTAMKLDELAARLGFKHAEALFEAVGKDEYSLRHIEAHLRPAEPAPSPDAAVALRHERQQEAARAPERRIAVQWGRPRGDDGKPALYPVDVVIEASARANLLRDVSEVFAKEKINVAGARVHDAAGEATRMHFTVEVADAARLAHVLAQVARVPGVRSARRR
jgi:GTP pyrophosphokinase